MKQAVDTQTIVKAKLRTPISTAAVIQFNGFWTTNTLVQSNGSFREGTAHLWRERAIRLLTIDWKQLLSLRQLLLPER